MTIRLAVLPYGPSDSCVSLRDSLVAAFANNREVAPRKLKSENSNFQGRAGDIIVNYGNRSAPATVFGSAIVLNPQTALNNAANKLTALRLMQQAGVSTIPFTTDTAEANRWIAAGDTVYQRNTLTGHSGEGIVTLTAGSTATRAPLYTKGITGQRREWRVHIFKGVIRYVQCKRRANGYEQNPEYREDVRNHHTGWIYATENINPSDAVLRNAVAAVAALGLDFGAVDIISRRDDAWVLEVNTAPGLTGTTLEQFTASIVAFVEHRRTGRQLALEARFPTPTAGGTGTATRNTAVPPAPGDTANAAPAAATTVSQEMQRNPGNREASARPDGYYVANVQNQDGRVSTRCILWSANNRWYRHGWNHPIPASQVSGIAPVGSVNIANGGVEDFAVALER